MRLRLSAIAALVVTCCLLPSVALAGPKDDVAAATMTWGETLGQNDPDKIILL